MQMILEGRHMLLMKISSMQRMHVIICLVSMFVTDIWLYFTTSLQRWEEIKFEIMHKQFITVTDTLNNVYIKITFLSKV